MKRYPDIITERVDDIPLLLEQMQRMGLPTLIDHHFPPTAIGRPQPGLGEYDLAQLNCVPR